MEPQPAFDPYAPPAAVSAPPVEIETEELPLAERSDRLWAKVLDGVAMFVTLLPIAFTAQGSELGWLIGFSALALLLLVQAVLLHASGQTLGKKVFGIRIVRTDGRRAGLARLVVLRVLAISVLGRLPYAGGFISLADVLLIFRADRRCLHDHIADTTVVTCPRTDPPETPPYLR